MYFVEHSGKHSMLKVILFSIGFCFLLAEVEQVYHKIILPSQAPNAVLSVSTLWAARALFRGRRRGWRLELKGELFSNKSVDNPFVELRDRLIMLTQIFDPLAYNLGTLLQGRIKFVVQARSSARIDDQHRLIR